MIRQEDIKVGMEITFGDISRTRGIYLVVKGLIDLFEDSVGTVEYVGNEPLFDMATYMANDCQCFYFDEDEIDGIEVGFYG